MRHARAEALDRLEPLLAQIRAVGVLSEKSRGIFYLKSKAWLHFHEDPAGLFADIRGEDGDFDRLKLDEASTREIVARVAALADLKSA
jgi:hypothetical protein